MSRDWTWENEHGWCSEHDLGNRLAIIMVDKSRMQLGDTYKVVDGVDDQGRASFKAITNDPSHVMERPFIDFDFGTAQRLWEVLDHYFRMQKRMVPAHEVEQANEMKAVREHLTDMRTLVFRDREELLEIMHHPRQETGPESSRGDS